MQFKNELEEIRYRRSLRGRKVEPPQKSLPGGSGIRTDTDGNGQICPDPSSPLYVLGGNQHREWMVRYSQTMPDLMHILTQAFMVIATRNNIQQVTEDEYREYYRQVVTLISFLSILRGQI